MTTEKTRKTARSPLRGASRNALAIYRGLAVGVRDWERAAIAGNYYWLPPAMTILGNSGGIFQAHARDRFQMKAWDRLQAHPSWPKIQEKFELERLKRFDPKAYEVRLLREELAAHTRECNGPAT